MAVEREIEAEDVKFGKNGEYMVSKILGLDDRT